MENISRAFEWIAVGELVLVFIAAAVGVVYDLRRGASPLATYHHWRAIFGRGLLVSLEIRLIVVVRTMLSFALDVEIDGVLPWRRGELQAQRDTG